MHENYAWVSVNDIFAIKLVHGHALNPKAIPGVSPRMQLWTWCITLWNAKGKLLPNIKTIHPPFNASQYLEQPVVTKGTNGRQTLCLRSDGNLTRLIYPIGRSVTLRNTPTFISISMTYPYDCRRIASQLFRCFVILSLTSIDTCNPLKTRQQEKA